MATKCKCRHCGKNEATRKITDLMNMRSLEVCVPCFKKSRRSASLN
ncbi:MAG: hypothetical protein KKE23_01475 [Nanoarchaeota archaeon]|nr:hypothetical protein [Nanoarchaeota archaeon]